MSWTYDSSLTTDKDRVRFLLRDTDTNRQLFQDEEIVWLISTEANIYMAAAVCADTMVAKMRGVNHKSVGSLSISYGASRDDWKMVAERLRRRGSTHMLPTAGGINISDRDTFWDDTDLIKPHVFSGLHEDPETKTPNHEYVNDEED